MNRPHTRWPLVLGIVLIATASSRTATNQKLDIAVKDRANAYASLAASGQFAAIAWGASAKEATDIYVAVSRDGGRAFGTPTRVAGDARLAGEQPPRIALVPRAERSPAIVVVWTASTSGGTRLLSARSDDEGRTFTPPAPLPGSDASGNRGWESVATNRSGGVVALWLDHRETATGRRDGAPMNHAEHQHLESSQRPADGVARAQLSKLWFATLGGAESPKALTGGVCYCCKTTIATDSTGAIYAAWRHVYEGNVRDIAFTKSSDDGRSFTPPLRVSDDNWVLDGCPENGPTMVVDGAKRIHIVWPTLVPGATQNSEPTLALFYAMSVDGKRFTARQRISTDGVPRHPQMIVDPKGGLTVAWDEQAKGTRRIALARGSVGANGVARFVKQPIGDAVRAEYPALALTSDGTLVAWTSGSVGQTALRTERISN
ncbi:MAG TPA: sialidase family protein [Vicinamibacterales bacterium]|nr:sialidase family protein [Vicinamibacterales bacterium]